MAVGGAAGWKTAGSKGAGKVFSHWIPDRYLKQTGSNFLRNVFGTSRFNGNYVSAIQHALHDPWAYRFMPRAWKAQNPIMNSLFRQLDRIPNFWKGLGAGELYAALSEWFRK